jgi:hypothetical protein
LYAEAGGGYFVGRYGAQPCSDRLHCDFVQGAVVNVGGLEQVNGVNFTLPRLRVQSLTPAEGAPEGGTLVTITGTNFVAGASVKFGDAYASIISVSPTAIVARTPPGVAGRADVTVADSASVVAKLERGFNYTAGRTKRRAVR